MKDGAIYDFVIDSTECTNKEIVCGMTVSLVSTKKSDKSVNWKRELYIKHYDPKEEKDVQEVHPSRLKFTKGDRIQVVDEKGSEYLIEEINGKMIKPFKTILYKAGI